MPEKMTLRVLDLDTVEPEKMVDGLMDEGVVQVRYDGRSYNLDTVDEKRGFIVGVASQLYLNQRKRKKNHER